MRIGEVNFFRVVTIGLLLFTYFFTAKSVYATHIRAGEITARRLNNFDLTYEFTFTGFRDTGSPIEFGSGVFDFGDGRSVENNFRIFKEPAGNGIEKVVFQVTHTYQAPAQYVVSYKEDFRNEGILNMSNSVATTFYVESKIVIDPAFGLNNTPTLTVPPIDFAAVGTLFIHNPGAQDLEGDSISYRFTTPLMARGTDVGNYRELNDPAFYSNFAQGNETQTDSPILNLNPVTGDLIWNAPGDAENSDGVREYNIAFVVVEWRRFAGEWFTISEVTRDMQIIVERTDNLRPTLELPDDLCVEAGSVVNEVITADDPDGHPVKIEAFGGPFEVLAPATFDPDPALFDGPPNFTIFNWETVCGHVRQRPYEVQFKATDDPASGPSLVNFETLQITVVGPSPTGLQSTVQPGKSIQLSWDAYSCSNADQMEVWRRVGDFPIDATDCQVGIPPNAGYQLIKTIGIDTTNYLDNNFGSGLSSGAKYCYRLVARFPEPSGGFSYVSAEACDSILIDVPVITNVDVRTTSETNGEILVRWAPPYQIDQSVYPPDYTYDLFRGITASSGTQRYEQIASGILDTTFIDTGINTLDNTHTYFVRFYDAGDVLVDSSSTAESVRLTPKPLLQSIELRWEAEVPWSNRVPEFPFHYVYRDQVDEFDPTRLFLIDSVDVSSSPFIYLDNGRFNDQTLDDETEYCYFVTTYGSYDNALLPAPLINSSQRICAQPNDTIPPCAPPVVMIDESFDCLGSLTERGCNSRFFVNRLEWTVNEDPDCDDDILSYNIYFSLTGLEEDYVFLESVTTTALNHEELTSYKGCYRVAAVDRSGNESELTEEVCNDNCPVYKLPNAFTPNKDGVNDFFTPLYSDGLNPIDNFNFADCPRFVEAVELSIFTRSGDEVFFYDSDENEGDILVNWDGTTKSGQDLASGVYFYEAKVIFDVLDKSEAEHILKGWVHLLR